MVTPTAMYFLLENVALCLYISTQYVSMGFGPREGSHLMFGFLIYNLQKKQEEAWKYYPSLSIAAQNSVGISCVKMALFE